jgi:hypothetical protein
MFGFQLLLAGLTPTRFQYMNAFTGYIGGASEIKSIEQQTVEHALPAAVAGGQYMAIDAVEPSGRANPGAYEQLAEVFDAMVPVDGLLPGRPIADVAVYWSMTSGIDFAESGTPLSEATFGLMLFQPHPHLLAFNGVVASARGRLPVGVITRKDLGRLAEHPVVVLPNVLRMDDEEVEAFRAYVEGGGRLIASGYTSLVDPDGTRHDDFRLADVFGCHFGGEDTRAVSYARPLDAALAQAIAPRRSIVFAGLPSRLPSPPVHAQSLSVTADGDAEVLVLLTLPYGEGRGTKDDQAWASIHASPPFEDTDRPVVVRHRYGDGEVTYLGGDLDACAALRAPAASLMLELLRSALPSAPTFELEGDRAVWAIAYRLPDDAGVRLAILNHPESLPARPTREVRVSMSAADGSPFAAVANAQTGEAIPFERDGEAGIRFVLEGIDGIVVLDATR